MRASVEDALNTGDPAVITVTLELLVEFTRASPAVGEALVLYYRQCCLDSTRSKTPTPAPARAPRQRALVARASTSRERGRGRERRERNAPSRAELIGRGRSKRNIGSLVRRALRALERRGGADALANIKYHIPTYRSCARVE